MKKIEDSFEIEEIKRVFVHELGHFLAEEINKKHNKGSGGKNIILFPNDKYPQFLSGRLEHWNPNNIPIDTKPPLERLPYFIEKVMMGCVFQSYLQNNNISNCLRPNADGEDDGYAISNETSYLSAKSRMGISTNEDAFLIKLKKNGVLDFVAQLSPLSYILWDEFNSNWYVDLNKLMSEIDSDNLATFETYYLELVNKIEEIMGKDNLGDVA
jgi:hypothetical protein